MKMSHNHKRDKKKTSNSDNLDDIIAMSNDEDIKKKRGKNDDDSDDEENDSEDDIDDDGIDDDTDDEMDDSDKKKKRKIKKINNETDDDDYSVPKIKAKKAKPHRQSEFTKEEISEIKKSKAVEELGNKLNNNLHQIQIALPYDQQLPRYVENNQQMIPKKKKSFWKRKQFKTTMKVIIYICIFIIFSVFVWKYIKAVRIINERNNVFVDENDEMNKGMNGGGGHEQEDGVNDDVLSERVYGSIGSEKQIKCKEMKIKNNVRNRDSRGRFVKKGK